MELTKEALEKELESVIAQGVQASRIIEQAKGAEMMIRHLLKKLEEEKPAEE